MTQLILILSVVFIVLFVLIYFLRKIKGVVISLILATVVLAGVVIYTLAVPESKLSIWITENIASSIEFDRENTVKPGDIIWETKCELDDKSMMTSDVKFDYDKDILNTLENIDLSKLTDTVNSFILDRMCTIAASKLDPENKAYSINFKDSYFEVYIEDSVVCARVIKGAKHIIEG